MSRAMAEGLLVVLLATLAVFALGWQASTWLAERREIRATRPVPYRLTLLGCMMTEPPPFYGRADRAFEMAIGEYDQREAEVSAEVDQIWRTITGDPKWRRWADPLRDRL